MRIEHPLCNARKYRSRCPVPAAEALDELWQGGWDEKSLDL